LHPKVDRGGDEESTSRSMTRSQQRYTNEGDLVLGPLYRLKYIVKGFHFLVEDSVWTLSFVRPMRTMKVIKVFPFL